MSRPSASDRVRAVRSERADFINVPARPGWCIRKVCLCTLSPIRLACKTAMERRSCSIKSATAFPTGPASGSTRLASALRLWSATPQSVSHGSWFSWLYGSHLLQPAKLLAPRYGSDRIAPRSTGAFTSKLSTSRSPFPLLGMTTTASLDSFCRRDLHPQE